MEDLSSGDLFQELLKHTLFGLDLRVTGVFALTGVKLPQVCIPSQGLLEAKGMAKA